MNEPEAATHLRPAANPVSAPWRPLPFLLAFAVLGSFYLWTTWSNNLSWHFGSEQRDYYNLLVHGFLDGKLSLKVDVPPELLRMADPYDPAKRPDGVALHDASLYHGRYYIYYGVVPAVVALLPFRLLTGVDLPVPIAVLVFALLGLAVALAMLAEFRRRYFPRCGPVMAFVLAVAWGFAACAPILVRRSSMYELPITCGSFFALTALGCLYLAMRGETRRVWWLAAASLAWGLANGSRPTYLIAPIGMLAAWPWIFRRPEGERIRGTAAIRLWAAAVVPLACVGGLLAAYNYVRFGSPTEFGVSYILSGVYESKIEHFRLRYAPWNFHAYFLSPAGWGRYFPFFHPLPIELPKPRQHYGMDYAFGLLRNVPFIWLMLLALVEFVRPAARRRTHLHAIVAAATWAGVTTAAFFLCFYAAMTRYLGDFSPMLALVAAVGGFAAIEHGACCGRWRQQLSSALVTLLAAATVFIVGVVSLDIYGRLLAFNPKTYATLARVADASVHAIEALSGRPAGAIELRVRLPERVATGSRQELLRTGWGRQFDRIVVDYPDDAHVAIGYEHADSPVFATPPLALDCAQEHTITVAFGSMVPPDTWPGYAGWKPEQVAYARRHLAISIDGKLMLERRQRFYASTPGNVSVGARGTPMAFTGSVDHVRRIALEPAPLDVAAAFLPVPLPPDGVWRLSVRFPEGEAGSRQPLLISGETGRADFIAVEFMPNHQLRLLLDHWGSKGMFSEPFAYEPGRTYAVEISHAAYMPASADKPTSARLLAVYLDGRPVWRAQATLYPADGEDVFLGVNPLGGSSCSEKFGGTIELRR